MKSIGVEKKDKMEKMSQDFRKDKEGYSLSEIKLTQDIGG